MSAICVVSSLRRGAISKIPSSIARRALIRLVSSRARCEVNGCSGISSSEKLRFDFLNINFAEDLHNIVEHAALKGICIDVRRKTCS